MVAGSYLPEGAGLLPRLTSPYPVAPRLPVIASTNAFTNESLIVTVQRLSVPPTVDIASLPGSQAGALLQSLTGPTVETQRVTASSMYRKTQPLGVSLNESGYRSASSVRYTVAAGGVLTPIETGSSSSLAWPFSADVQFATTEDHTSVGSSPSIGSTIVGMYNVDKLPGFSAASRVPLQTYYPPVVQGANAASRKALHDQPLLPSTNVGGYVTQPPLLLTSINAALPLLDPANYSGGDGAAPISSIRVRVSGVHGVDPLSIARIKLVAQTIQQRTGLRVDITAGSSPTSVSIALPAGRFGRPQLLLQEAWTETGVAVVILQSLDSKSLVIFVLVLVVCVLFLANGAYASVRSRRTELGVLACLGWGRAALFRLVLGELALVGLGTGVIGAASAEILALALRLQLPWWHALLVVPIALGLACVAGLAPAYAATRGRPLDAVYSVPSGGGRHRPVRHVSGIARANLLRRPARLVSGALGLFIGVAAFAVLLGVQLAFQGQVVGTALGNVVSVQVRSVDLIAAVLALLLGAFSVADVLAVNLRDRAGEQAVLAATGWRPATLFRLAFTEGMVVGIVGAITGGAVGLGLAAVLTGSALAVTPAAILAALIGLILVGAVLMVPAWQASQTAPAAALAED
jgi:ABC-type lipoprotein release transport system permease subunit